MQSVSSVDLRVSARAVANASSVRFSGKGDDEAPEKTPGGIILPNGRLLTDVFGYAGKGEVGTTHMDLLRGVDLLRPGDSVLVDAPLPRSMRLIEETGEPPRAALLAHVASNDDGTLLLDSPFVSRDGEGEGPPAIGINKRAFITSAVAGLQRWELKQGRYGKLPPTLDLLRAAQTDPDKPWEQPEIDEKTLAARAERFDDNTDMSAKAMRERRRALTDFLGLNERLLRSLVTEEDRIRELAERRKRPRQDMPDLELPTGKIASRTWHHRLSGIVRALTQRGRIVEPNQIRDRDMLVRVRGFVGATADEPLKVIVAPDSDTYQTPTTLKGLKPHRLFDPVKWAVQLLSPFGPTARENSQVDVAPDARVYYTMLPKGLKVVRGQDNLFMVNPSHN